MKILYLGYYDEGCVANRSKIYLRKALKKHAEVICYGPHGFNWKKTRNVQRLEQIYKPDILLFQGFWTQEYNKTWDRVRKAKAPKVVFITDPHRVIFREQIYRKFINKNKIDMSLWGSYYLIQPCRKLFFAGHKMRWLPWCVDTEIFKNYNLQRIYDVGFLGMVSEFYRFREIIINKLSKSNLKFLYKKRPKAGLNLNPKKALMDERYAKFISQCKMFIFGNPRILRNEIGFPIRYALQKYFESMATQTLTLAPIPTDAGKLHFIPDYNFIQVDRNNFMKKIRYYLKYPNERLRIAKNGYNTIQKHHSSTIRAQQLFNILKELI